MFLISSRRRFPVFEPDADRIAFDVGFGEAQRMVDQRQACLITGGRALRLSAVGEPHECRTHTSRGGMLAAIGRGQKYTYTESAMIDTGRKQITSFKKIHAEDRNVFRMATLSCMVPPGT